MPDISPHRFDLSAGVDHESELLLKDPSSGRWIPADSFGVSPEALGVRELPNSLLWRKIQPLEEALLGNRDSEEIATLWWSAFSSPLLMERFCALDLLAAYGNEYFDPILDTASNSIDARRPLGFLARRFKRPDADLRRILDGTDLRGCSLESLARILPFLGSLAGEALQAWAQAGGTGRLSEIATFFLVAASLSKESLYVLKGSVSDPSLLLDAVLPPPQEATPDRLTLAYELALLSDTPTLTRPAGFSEEERRHALFVAAGDVSRQSVQSQAAKNPFHPLLIRPLLPYPLTCGEERFSHEVIEPWSDVENDELREHFVLRLVKARMAGDPNRNWLELAETAGAYHLFLGGHSNEEVLSALQGERDPLVSLVAPPRNVERTRETPPMPSPGGVSAAALWLAAGMEAPVASLRASELEGAALHLPTIGIEIQSVSPHLETVIGWKELLTTCGVRSAYRTDMGGILEASILPAFAASTIGAHLSPLESLGFFETSSEPMAVHISLGGLFGDDLPFLVAPLLGMNQRWIDILSQAGPERHLSAVMSKGLVCEDTEILPLDDEGITSRTEIRVVTLAPPEAAGMSLQELPLVLEALQTIGFWSRRRHSDPNIEELWRRYTTRLQAICKSAPEGDRLLKIDYRDATGDAHSPELVGQLPAIAGLLRCAALLGHDTLLRQTFREACTGLLLWVFDNSPSQNRTQSR